MNCTFSKLAAITLLIGGITSHAQADTQWRTPFKGAPYAVAHEHVEATLAKVKTTRANLKVAKQSNAK